jgi:hypothetical protein
VTHLVALSSMGDKYKYATTFSIPVLTEDWLQAAWDNRHNIGYRSVIELFLTFQQCCGSMILWYRSGSAYP